MHIQSTLNEFRISSYPPLVNRTLCTATHATKYQKPSPFKYNFQFLFFQENPMMRVRRQAKSVDDLGIFTTFMKRNDFDLEPFTAFAGRRKRAARYSPQELGAALGTFSSFMDPSYHYY